MSTRDVGRDVGHRMEHQGTSAVACIWCWKAIACRHIAKIYYSMGWQGPSTVMRSRIIVVYPCTHMHPVPLVAA